jgi:phosphoserine phosphatase
VNIVATLISGAGEPAITAALVDAARAALAVPSHAAVLDEGIAVDLFFDLADAGPGALSQHASALIQDPKSLNQIASDLRQVLAGQAIDVVVQLAARRRKRLFLADMDSTMIGQECIDELADFVGLKAEVAGITERAMRGEIAFEPALRQRVALLKTLPVGVIDEIIERRITLTPGARTLVQTLKVHGVYTCLVSGGFTLFTGPVAAKIGFDEHRSNLLMVEGDRLAGHVQEPILGREAKLQTLIELRERLALDPADTMAVGDGANDLAMIEAAGLGVAYHAKPAVAAAAHARIDHGDLTALLYAQGYRRADFVTA